MRFGIINFLITALDIPFSPGSNDFQVRIKVHDAKLKPDLIISFSGTAMADSIGMLLMCDLHNALCKQRTCKAGTKKVSFIIGTGLHGRNNIIIDEFFCQILDIQFTCTTGFCTFFKIIQFISLSDITTDSNYFVVIIMFFQPGDDDGSIKTTGIR